VNWDNIGQYEQVHQAKKYGVSSEILEQELMKLLTEVLPTCSDIPVYLLDWGAGQSQVIKRIGHRLMADLAEAYDPAVNGRRTIPTLRPPARSGLLPLWTAVLCTDVMEHIPEEDVEEVLTILEALSHNVLFTIHMAPAIEVLPNGKNAHCTLKHAGEWLDLIKEHWPTARIVKKDLAGNRVWIVTWP